MHWLNFSIRKIGVRIFKVLLTICISGSRPPKRLQIRHERAKIRQNPDGKYSFPDEIKYTIKIEGMPRIRIQARKALRPTKTPTKIIRTNQRSEMHSEQAEEKVFGLTL